MTCPPQPSQMKGVHLSTLSMVMRCSTAPLVTKRHTKKTLLVTEEKLYWWWRVSNLPEMLVLTNLIRQRMQTAMLLVHQWEILIDRQEGESLDAPGQLLSLVVIAESFTRLVKFRPVDFPWRTRKMQRIQAFCIEPKLRAEAGSRRPELTVFWTELPNGQLARGLLRRGSKRRGALRSIVAASQLL